MLNENLRASVLQKAMLMVAAAVAFASLSWPNSLILKTGLEALGNPPYAGFKGAFLPHLLLYSTLGAGISALLWWLFVRAGLLAPPQLRGSGRIILLGVVGGILSLAVTLAVAWAIFPAGAIHWIDPVPWKIAGNLFSNFFEEFIFRGFILAALQPVAGFWVAALASSALWAVTHTQYPLAGQLLIFVIGVGYCWLLREAGSLWAPYTAHMVLDLMADSLIG
jgi:membrane protease YdiL (CAAX protease family)